jgi:hypothetical protein
MSISVMALATGNGAEQFTGAPRRTLVFDE